MKRQRNKHFLKTISVALSAVMVMLMAVTVPKMEVKASGNPTSGTVNLEDFDEYVGPYSTNQKTTITGAITFQRNDGQQFFFDLRTDSTLTTPTLNKVSTHSITTEDLAEDYVYQYKVDNNGKLYVYKDTKVTTPTTHTASLNVSGLTNATATLSKTTDITAGDTLTLTITPASGRIFDETPVAEVTSGTGTIPTYDANLDTVYTYSITNVSSDIIITVTGSTKSVSRINLSNGNVGITDASANTDYFWIVNDTNREYTAIQYSNDTESVRDTFSPGEDLPLPMNLVKSCFLRYSINNDTVSLYMYTTKPAPLPSGSCGGSSTPAPQKTLESTNYASTVLNSWEAVNKALEALVVPELTPGESSVGTAPMLKVNISGTDKVIAKTTQDVIKDENKGLHVHLGDGFAITMLGQNMKNDNKDINAEFTMSDTVNGENKERTIDFTHKGDLTMSVILHAYLPDSVAGNTATIYVENADGTRTKVAEVTISDLNRICFSIDKLQKYVIEY